MMNTKFLKKNTANLIKIDLNLYTSRQSLLHALKIMRTSPTFATVG